MGGFCKPIPKTQWPLETGNGKEIIVVCPNRLRQQEEIKYLVGETKKLLNMNWDENGNGVKSVFIGFVLVGLDSNFP